MDFSAYNELASYTLSLGDPAFIHQYVVDARGASADLANAKPVRIFFALAGLYLLIERGYSGKKVQEAHMYMGRSKQAWPLFALPTTVPAMGPADVMRQPPGKQRDEAIKQWCAEVWETWSSEHARVREETDRLLLHWQ